MRIDVAESNSLVVYHALVGIVAPRPIAWVTTVDERGVVNLAPFSFFNAFGANPPVVVFSPTLRRNGEKKDTLRNVEATGEFTLNAAVEELALEMNATAFELPYGESELDFAGLETIPSVRVRPPRVARSPIHMECKVTRIVPIGDGPISANLVIGEVLMIHIDDRVLDAQGRIDPKKYRPLARLGGDWYSRASDLFEMPRPTR